ncbi:DWNN-domain-containing protein [Terfezia boudieri ATCC MYA-4762]|uniref:DWNN-domain-containing protein n=1 Tax=Terfezia boudieri ATCC MYA-4762 TaxID=1051890 RepID=A0A3N4MBX7_9PEZI|nr:DWNN-domain-containing protein [Terfezia boudieri ATCC MYA-4762]
MASSVFFKFKSQKEHTRVTFDGTGITVFDLKREIITLHKLGDGSDFNLHIYNEDTNEEYADDTTVIPRSTSIIARRLPPNKPGKGTAHRYVSSKMPTTAAPNAQRTEKAYSKPGHFTRKDEGNMNGSGDISAPAAATNGETEEERIAAMFQANSEVWNKTQEHMATATPIYRGVPQAGGFRKNTGPVPSHPPPQGYICYRCGEKGHWIQGCPTNADPTFDGRPRVKRTTGIPRSFLKTVEKPALPTTTEDDATTQRETPSSIMVNAEGEYVVAEPDKASWESYQQKAAKSSSKAETKGSKELQELGLECTVDHKLFKDAVKTPCCGKVYCEDCIHTLLFDSDFDCPSCQAKDILLDRLVVDTETRAMVEAYEKGDLKKEVAKEEIKPAGPVAPVTTDAPSVTAPAAISVPATKVTSASPTPAPSNVTPAPNKAFQASGATATPIPVHGSKAQSQPPTQPTKTEKIATLDSISDSKSPSFSKKRPFEEDSESKPAPQIPSGPKAMRVNAVQQNPNQFVTQKPGIMPHNRPIPTQQQFQPQPIPSGVPPQQCMYNNYGHNNHYQHGGYNGNMGANGGYGQYDAGMNGYYGGMNGQNGYMGGPGMMNNGMSTGMGPGGMGMGGGVGPVMGGNMHGMGPGPMGMNGGMNSRGGGMSMMGPGGHMGMGNGMAAGHADPSAYMINPYGGGMMGVGYQCADGKFGYFPNQQKTVFSEPFPNEEESAYIRKPVNPHRHARPKRIRPSDFKALGEQQAYE